MFRLRRSAALLIVLLLIMPAYLRAELRTHDVSYQDGSDALQGYLVYDDAITGPRPGVLVVHEWWGLNDYARDRAKQLAALGYVAFAVDMYGQGKTTTDPKQAGHWSGQFRAPDVMRRRALAGLELLAKHDRVDPTRLAAIGYCFGGTTVTQLAYGGADLKGVVSFHGSLPLPEADVTADQVKAKLLICHGADDTFVSKEHVAKFEQVLKDKGLPYQLLIYPGAKHSFTNPGADQFGIDGIAYDPQADQSSWVSMQAFFVERFNQQPATTQPADAKPGAGATSD